MHTNAQRRELKRQYEEIDSLYNIELPKEGVARILQVPSSLKAVSELHDVLSLQIMDGVPWLFMIISLVLLEIILDLVAGDETWFKTLSWVISIFFLLEVSYRTVPV